MTACYVGRSVLIMIDMGSVCGLYRNLQFLYVTKFESVFRRRITVSVGQI